jgi:hypothetical protein
MSFLGIRKSIAWLSENDWAGVTAQPRNEFPPATPQRVALQQSPPPLRRHRIMPIQTVAGQYLSLHELIREPAELARSALPRVLSIRTLGRICPLEMPDRGLNDRVHLTPVAPLGGKNDNQHVTFPLQARYRSVASLFFLRRSQ